MAVNANGGVQGNLVVGRYRLDETIGQGGMGRVWRAADEVLDRQVAVKEMRIDTLGAEDSRIQRERTLREARATARIDHPNVVRVYDVAEEDDRLWIVMEFVAGRSLEQVLAQDGPVSQREAARIGLALARALREVHEVGVLHRDIKPGNVLTDTRGRVVLTDFGIAAIQDAAALTMAGMLIGSPDYMAPERIEGRQQGPPSDLWSLGATLCAAVAGRSPFARPTTLATLHAVLYEEPEIPPEAGPLRPVLAALLRKNPDERPMLNATWSLLAALSHPSIAPSDRPPAPEPVPEPEPAVHHEPTLVVSAAPAAPSEAAPADAVQPDGQPERPPDAVLTAARQEPGGGTGGKGGGRHRRRPVVLAAVGVVAAAATAAAVVLTAQGTAGGGPVAAGVSTPAQTSPSGTVSGGTPASTAPGTRDETGFSWVPPAGWTRSAKSPSNVHYHAPGGAQEVAASYTLADGGDLPAQWQEFEAASHDVPGYRKIRLADTTFRGRPAVVWEYAFTDDGEPWHARQLGFTAGGKSYQLNIWYADRTEAVAPATYERVKASFEPR